MSVAVDSVGTKFYQNAVTTKDVTFTVSAGSNLALMAVLNFGSSPTSITVTWDQGVTAQAMTQLVSKGTALGAQVSTIFGLRAPTVGTLTARISWTGSSEIFGSFIQLSGVEQSSDGAAFPHTNSAESASTINVTSAVGNLVIACESSGSGQGTATGTLIYDDHTSGAIINAMAEYDVGAASVTIGNSGSNSTIAGVDVVAAAGGGGGGVFSWANYYCRQVAGMAASLMGYVLATIADR